MYRYFVHDWAKECYKYPPEISLTKRCYFDKLKLFNNKDGVHFMSQDHLRVLGMIFHAYHGLDQDEIKNGQRFEVDVDLLFDAEPAAKSDRIKDTIDVREVYRVVQDVVVNDRFYLIEAVSEHIAQRVLEKFPVFEVIVRVRKPFAPLGGLANGTEIEIFRKRE